MARSRFPPWGIEKKDPRQVESGGLLLLEMRVQTGPVCPQKRKGGRGFGGEEAEKGLGIWGWGMCYAQKIFLFLSKRYSSTVKK